MFVIAIDEWGIPIKANPLSKIRFKGSDIRRERRLNEDEFQEIIQAANKTQTPHLASIIEFAIETGMRRGEMLAMRWKDVDLEKSQIKIPQTKTGIPRTIPITPRAKALLTGIQKQNGPVFELSANALQLAWQRLIKGLDVDDLHFHDLRHEAISRFFEMGLTMPEVATISGHQDVRMLLRYAHANINMLLKKFDTIN